MPPKVSSLPSVLRKIPDPARDAARLLGWIGLAVLMVGAPLVGVLSRRALFVLLPVGAGVMVAAFLLSVSNDGLRALREAFREPIGLGALFLVSWSALSLVWTPFPSLAAPRFLETVTIALFALLIIAHMPERRARPTLYLLPAGLAVTGLATLGMALFGPASFRGGTEFDPSLLERSILTLLVLVWPALGALCAFGRWRLAMALAALVAGVATAAVASIAMAVFALGAVSFALAVTDARRAALGAAIVFGGIVLLAPVLPFALAPLAKAIPMVGHSTIAAMEDWRGIITDAPVRLLTGHGLDTARQGVDLAILPGHTPRSILFEIWHELGLLGAAAAALVFALGLMAASNAAPLVAPALLAGIVTTLAIAIFGVATAQVWFVALASLQAVAFGLLCRSSRGGAAPSIGLSDGRGRVETGPSTSA